MLPSRIASFKLVPLEVRRVMYHAPPAPNDYVELFQRVIGRAIMDALGWTGIDKPTEHNRAVRAARVWFKFGENVEEMFDDAKIKNYHVVREHVLNRRPFLRPDV